MGKRTRGSATNSIFLGGRDSTWSNLPKPSLDGYHFPDYCVLGSPSAVDFLTDVNSGGVSNNYNGLGYDVALILFQD